MTAFLFQENMTDFSETTAEQKEWKVSPFESKLKENLLEKELNSTLERKTISPQKGIVV